MWCSVLRGYSWGLGQSFDSRGGTSKSLQITQFWYPWMANHLWKYEWANECMVCYDWLESTYLLSLYIAPRILIIFMYILACQSHYYIVFILIGRNKEYMARTSFTEWKCMVYLKVHGATVWNKILQLGLANETHEAAFAKYLKSSILYGKL